MGFKIRLVPDLCGSGLATVFLHSFGNKIFTGNSWRALPPDNELEGFGVNINGMILCWGGTGRTTGIRCLL